jgi:tripartite-type tricarboxylate transporter receptor subunit TctC
MKKILKTVLSIMMMLSMSAYAYNDKTTRLVVPFSAGGSTDLVARIVAEGLKVNTNQNIIVENKVGAGGSIATRLVANAPNDGSVLLMSTVSTFGSNHAFMKDPGFDPVADFEHIITVASTPKVLAVRSDFPANTIQELVALLKQHPNRYVFGTTGQSTDELYVKLFARYSNTETIFVPYKGGAPALVDLLGGHTDLLIDNLPLVIQHVREGKLKLLAISWSQRLSEFPNVSTWNELGYHDMNFSAWQGIVAPQGLSTDKIANLNSSVKKILAGPDVQKRLQQAGFYTVGDSPTEAKDLTRKTYRSMIETGRKNNIVKN